MIDWFIRRRLTAFAQRYAYDTGYASELLAISRPAFWHYARVAGMARHREGIAAAPWHCAKLVAARSGDCGPCTQLAVDLAREAGVPDAQLSAVLRADVAVLEPDNALAVRYAEAAIARSPELPALLAEVRQRFGERGLASLALVVTATRVFPMLKYALGHGQACQRVQVGLETVTPAALRHAA